MNDANQNYISWLPKTRILPFSTLVILCIQGCTLQPTSSDSNESSEEITMLSKPSLKASAKGGKSSVAVMHRLEKLHAFSVHRGEINFTVTGTGCTSIEDFSIETEVDGGKCYVSVYRTKADRCRRAPAPVNLKMAWDMGNRCELGTVTTRNPMSSNEALDRKPVYK
ncbi:MAG TPA: hypothetical protein DD827_07355 [Gammaproteobacteria bacterium]|jgi:hypothetical protein|nr:hypothetical protein [Gammaproteobacteria bacterium]